MEGEKEKAGSSSSLSVTNKADSGEEKNNSEGAHGMEHNDKDTVSTVSSSDAPAEKVGDFGNSSTETEEEFEQKVIDSLFQRIEENVSKVFQNLHTSGVEQQQAIQQEEYDLVSGIITASEGSAFVAVPPSHNRSHTEFEASSAPPPPSSSSSTTTIYQLILSCHELMERFEMLNIRRLQAVAEQKAVIAELRGKLQEYNQATRQASTLTATAAASTDAGQISTLPTAKQFVAIVVTPAAADDGEDNPDSFEEEDLVPARDLNNNDDNGNADTDHNVEEIADDDDEGNE